MSVILQNLNKPQHDAVTSINGASLIIAGAGSGKTRVLTHRIAYLLAQNVPSYKILALTFTNKAADEMKERISLIVGDAVARDLWMGTFHSVFAKILRIESEHIGFSSNFTIYDSQDSKSLITKIIADLQLDKDTYKPGTVAAIISKAKNDMLSPEDLAADKDLQQTFYYKKIPFVNKVYSAYINRCRQSNAMDFDDLLLYTNTLFNQNPQILHKYQQRFEYILVDEFQDTNISQYAIIKQLAAPQNNICVVGDDAQSIYSFRGAKIENILSFTKDFKQCNTYKLEQNYRSTQTIVNAANSVIKKNKYQIPKNTFSEAEEGEKIEIISAQTDIEEGVIVSNKIKNLIQNNIDFSDIAILYRTNAQSRIFEEVLRKYNYPYKIFGGLSFFQRKEIKDVSAYFRVVINPKDSEALIRIINYPARGIGKTTTDKLQLVANNQSIPLWTVVEHVEQLASILTKGAIAKIVEFRNAINSFIADLHQVGAYSLAHRIVEKTGIFADLKADSSVEGTTKLDNLQELLNAIKEFEEQETDQTAIFLHNYLERISLLSDIQDDKSDNAEKISLMTIHSAKGLEFSHCFLVGLEEGLFPSTMSSQQSEIEEERRLFYVALTRAKSAATISYATSRRKWGNLETCLPSRFIQEIDEEFVKDSQHKGFSRTSFLSSYQQGSAKPNPQQFSSFKKPQQPTKLPKIENFTPDNPLDIKEGHKVLHNSFGYGNVLAIEGNAPNISARIDFQIGGEKKLLLKFAKLQIISNN